MIRMPLGPRASATQCCAAALLAWLAADAAADDGPIRFRDVTAQSGIDFVHTHGGSGRKYIVETVTAGLALFDYDNDGKTDIYFLNGRPLTGTKAAGQPKNHLYRNLGGMKFKDVTDQAGVGGGAGFGLGVCVGDYDNDGYQDLYVSNYGENILYHNNGDGTFSDVTRKAGVARGHKVVREPASWTTTTMDILTCSLRITWNSPNRNRCCRRPAVFPFMQAPELHPRDP